MLAQHARDFVGGGPGVKNDAMARFNQIRRRLRNTAFDRRIKRTFILDGRLYARRIAVANQRATVGANGDALFFEERQIVTDRHR
ncbi:hypothetical protein D3C71_1758100 [compost metagenome]